MYFLTNVIIKFFKKIVRLSSQTFKQLLFPL